MSLRGILFYVGRAMTLALPVSAAAYGLRRLQYRGTRLDSRREGLVYLFFLYLAALLAITAIRDGEHLSDFWKIPHDTASIQLIPIVVTWQQGRAGAWYLIYPIVGNLLWFVPYGWLLRRLRPNCGWGRTVLMSMSLSLAIEVAQWVLLSGISDIDDVIFNTLGGLLGWCLCANKEK